MSAAHTKGTVTVRQKGMPKGGAGWCVGKGPLGCSPPPLGGRQVNLVVGAGHVILDDVGALQEVPSRLQFHKEARFSRITQCTFVPCSALTRGEERKKRTCCQSVTQVTNRLPRSRRGGRQAPHGIRRNPPGQPRRVPLRGASQCLKSMSDQLAYRRVWQKVHARHRDFCHSHCP